MESYCRISFFTAAGVLLVIVLASAIGIPRLSLTDQVLLTCLALILIGNSFVIRQRLLKPLAQLEASLDACCKPERPRRCELPKEVGRIHSAIYQREQSCPHLKQRDARLREQMRKQDLILDAVVEGIFLAMNDGEVTYCNTAFAETLGHVDKGHVIGHSLWKLLPDPFDLVESASEDNRGTEMTTRFETTIRTPQGQERILYCATRPFMNPDNQEPGMIGTALDITSIRRAERQLSHNEKRYTNLVEQTPMAIQIHRPDGVLLSANPAFRRIWGISSEQLEILVDSYNIFTDKQAVTSGLVQAIDERLKAKNPDPVTVEYDFRQTLAEYGLSGTVFRPRWIQMRVCPVINEQNQLEQLVLLSEDVTDQRMAQTAVREADLRREQAVSAGNVGLWDWDLRTNEVYYSREWKAQIGYAEDEIANEFEEWRRRVHPDDLEDTLASVESLVNNCLQHHKLEFRFQHKSGKYIWIMAQASVIRDREGKPARVLGAHLDVTELRESRIALQQSELRLRAITDVAQDAIVMIDEHGDISFWNPAAEKVFGYHEGEVLGRNLHELLAPERYLDGYFQAFPEFQRTGQGGAVGNTLNLEAVRKDGLEISIQLSLSAVRLDNKWRAVGVIRDVTDQQLLERQLRQSQKHEALGTLAAGIAHDFNNMLTAIIGSAHLIQQIEGADRELLTHTTEISKTAMRAASLTKQLLSYSRRKTEECATIELNATIKEMVQMLRRVIGEEVDLQVELHSGSLPVRIDPVQFEQVILNLVINARDAMNNRGTIHVATSRVELDEPRIKCEHELPAGSYAKISCRDTGTGISDSVVERIFEPFFTTKEVGKGTGLGLSTSYGIICQFQGSIEVDSQPGQGATFTVWLPLCLDEPDELIPADRWFGSSDDRHCTDPGFYGEDYNHGRV